ncbi:MAG: BlaI/MecI/CopY family transcriptional regulator, partial [Bacteroidaceae bacterium]|nr:BlaI/MecI/CopY family transcriptional regulator [Bacteroidaceae bacterium]
PLISKDEYTSRVMRDVKNNFFGGSVSSFLSFFLKEENLSQKELEELIKKVES